MVRKENVLAEDELDPTKYRARAGWPKLIAQLWNLTKLMWFDETFMLDPYGYEAELSLDSFLGLFFFHLVSEPTVEFLFWPIMYLWFDLALITQIISFIDLGAAPVDLVAQYEKTR